MGREVHCRRLALADFGRDPRSSDSWRARRNYVLFLSGKQRTISRRPNFAKFEHVDRCRDENFRNRILKIFTVRVVFQKIQTFLKKFLTSCDFRRPELRTDYRSTEIHYQMILLRDVD